MVRILNPWGNTEWEGPWSDMKGLEIKRRKTKRYDLHITNESVEFRPKCKMPLSLCVCAGQSGTLWAWRSRKDWREWAGRMESSGTVGGASHQRWLSCTAVKKLQKPPSGHLGGGTSESNQRLSPSGCQCPTSDKTLSWWRFATWRTLSVTQAPACVRGRAQCIMGPGYLPSAQGALRKEVRLLMLRHEICTLFTRKYWIQQRSVSHVLTTAEWTVSLLMTIQIPHSVNSHVFLWVTDLLFMESGYLAAIQDRFNCSEPEPLAVISQHFGQWLCVCEAVASDLCTFHSLCLFSYHGSKQQKHTTLSN